MENSKKSGRPAAIITGASSGIGLEIGKTLCQMGYEVYGIGRSFDCADIVYEEDVDDMGFDEDALKMAYERTCLNTGGLKWAYMNKILLRWHEAGLHTGAAVEKGDRKEPANGSGKIGEAEMDAIRRVLREE